MLAGFAQDLTDFILRRKRIIKRAILELLAETDPLRPAPDCVTGDGDRLDRFLHIELDFIGIDALFGHGGAFDASVFTAVHLNHTPVDGARFHITAKLDTVGQTVNGKLPVMMPVGFRGEPGAHRGQNPACYRI